MKLKRNLFALCLICAILPVSALDAELDKGEGGGAGGGPRLQVMTIPPVVIEIEPGVVSLTFTSYQGMASLRLQDPTGMIVASQEMDTSVNNKTSFNLPAGTYYLTITAANEATLMEVSLLIP